MVGTGTPKLRGRTCNEAIASPQHLFHLRGERSRGRAHRPTVGFAREPDEPVDLSRATDRARPRRRGDRM